MKLYLSLILFLTGIVTIFSLDIQVVKNNMDISENLNNGIAYGNAMSKSFNGLTHPRDSLTYNNPLLDGVIDLPIIGPTFNVLATTVKVTEKIKENIIDYVSENSIDDNIVLSGRQQSIEQHSRFMNDLFKPSPIEINRMKSDIMFEQMKHIQSIRLTNELNDMTTSFDAQLNYQRQNQDRINREMDRLTIHY